MSVIKVLLSLLLLVSFLLFIAQNSGYVDVSLFYATYRVPIFLLLLMPFALGLLPSSLYLLMKEASFKRRLRNIDTALRELFRGYPFRAERAAGYSGASYEGLNALRVHALRQYDHTQSVMVSDPTSLSVLGMTALLWGKLDEAEQYLRESFEKDRENLRTIKSLRDIHALREEWQQALEFQEMVIQLCEKWERDRQKRTKAEIMAKVYLETGEERTIEKAVDTHASPFVYAIYLRHLLSTDNAREAKKTWEKILSQNLQEDVLWILLEDQSTLTKLLNLVENSTKSLSPDTLAMLYIKLNLLSKVKGIEGELSTITKAIHLSSTSHREQDAYCLKSLLELLKPFVCSCGRSYRSYTPICHGCLKWGEVRFGRLQDAG